MKKTFKKWLYLGLAAFMLIMLCSVSSWAREGNSEYKQDVKLTQLLKSMTTTIGQPIEYSKIKKPEVTALKVEIPPGKETGWHKHPFPGYAYVLRGTVTLEIEGNKQFRFEPGSAFVEVLNTLHNGKNLGNEPVTILVFFTAEAGQPYTIRANKE
ncbi:cupin domain-containing protein [Scytonema sp. UIC 10036]|uniref:cupin domain-containing protein n=1 Tax=Scytonema sp. UIC 10036 TaxID=2304196 RepID=UPI0012DA2F8B|nr:cupin domain-containing protein [Scytonema sp. UIC 10036]MUG98381.1 cupin domain-containing protein [Scytonema sp. UIC 10036]